MSLEIEPVDLHWEEGANIIVGQSHFIKTMEDIPELLVTSVPGIEYGLAFCEASGPALIRTEGSDEKLVEQAVRCARDVGAGHSFFLILRNCYPINILNQLKNCQEVVRIYAATANPLQVLVTRTDQGGGIVGVVDGYAPKGVEGEEETRSRKELLRKIGYKLN